MSGTSEMRAAAVGQQLQGFDAVTWRTAAHDRNMRSSIISLSLLDSVPDWERLRSRFIRLTHLVPLLRERPLFGAVGVSAPRMAVDPDFDIDIHLRRMRIREGCDWQDVLGEARRMSLTDFDHSRPLWEAVLLEGLPGDRAALMLKLHHAMADGEAMVTIIGNLFELTREGQPDESPLAPPPTPEPASVAMVSRADIRDNVTHVLAGVADGVKSAAGMALNLVKRPAETMDEAVRMAKWARGYMSVPESPVSPLMTGRSTTYRFATFDFDFADMRAAAKRRGVTVNDLFIGCVSTGLADYHTRHNRPAQQLRFNVPISLRSSEQDGSGANAVALARFTLPVNGASIDERIEAAHVEVARWRDESATPLANPLAELSRLVPVSVMAKAAKGSDVTVSNLPGPPIPIFVCGAEVVGTWPLVPTVGAATNITLVTYAARAFVGMSVDEVAIPDVADFVNDVRGGFAEVIGGPIGSTDPTEQAPPQVASAR